MLSALIRAFTPRSVRINRQITKDAKLAQKLAVPGLDAYVVRPPNAPAADWHPRMRAFFFAKYYRPEAPFKLPPASAFPVIAAAVGAGYRGDFKIKADGTVYCAPMTPQTPVRPRKVAVTKPGALYEELLQAQVEADAMRASLSPA